MRYKNKNFRHVLLFYFRKAKKATQAYKEICEAYGINCLTECRGQIWLKKFHPADFPPKGDQRFGLLLEVDDENFLLMKKTP